MTLVEELQQLITAPILRTEPGILMELAEGEGVPANARDMLKLLAAKCDGLEQALLRLASIVESQQRP